MGRHFAQPLFIYYVTRTNVHEKNEKKKCRKKTHKTQTKENMQKHTKNTSRKTHHMVHIYSSFIIIIHNFL